MSYELHETAPGIWELTKNGRRLAIFNTAIPSMASHAIDIARNLTDPEELELCLAEYGITTQEPGLIDKDGYIVLLSLSRNDVASHLSNTPMEEDEANKLAASLTDDELESIAELILDNEAFMDDFWMTLEYAIQEEAPRLLIDPETLAEAYDQNN